MLFEMKDNQPWESQEPNQAYDHKQHLQQTMHLCFPSLDNGCATLLYSVDELVF